MNKETLEQILKYAFIMTFLMALFSTGVNTMMLRSSNVDTSWTQLLWQAAKTVGPFLLLEGGGYLYLRKKNEEARKEAERLEKERKQAAYKANRAQRRAEMKAKKK